MGSLMVSGIVRLTRDAEARKTTMGTWYNIGISAYRKNPKEGKQQVDFFDADLYMKVPPAGYEKNLTKGRLLYIETAYLRNDQFVGQDGKEKTRVKLQISGFELLGDQVSNEAMGKQEVKKTVDAVSKIKLPTSGSTHPSDLPLPMVYNTTKEKEVSAIELDEEIPF
jgi:single-stranded DNA-binding protein